MAGGGKRYAGIGIHAQIDRQTEKRGIPFPFLDQAFSQAVQIVIRFAEVPLLLGFWGTQFYGDWFMRSAIPVYLFVRDGGFAPVTCRDMSMDAEADDRRAALASFKAPEFFLICDR